MTDLMIATSEEAEARIVRFAERAIDTYRSRMPDLLCVRQQNMVIVQQRAIYGAPDLVLELVSSNDRPIGLVEVETDYRTVGVSEIVFIDQQKRRVKLLRKHDSDYRETALVEGNLRLRPCLVSRCKWSGCLPIRCRMNFPC